VRAGFGGRRRETTCAPARAPEAPRRLHFERIPRIAAVVQLEPALAQEFAGLGSNGPTTIVSITGGTGRYMGAEGEVTSRSLNRTLERDTIHIIG
jgi:hypothetical protein